LGEGDAYAGAVPGKTGKFGDEPLLIHTLGGRQFDVLIFAC